MTKRIKGESKSSGRIGTYRSEEEEEQTEETPSTEDTLKEQYSELSALYNR